MGTHGIFKVPPARNEPVRGFEPGSPERISLQAHLDRMTGERIEAPLVIGGKDVFTGNTRPAVMPHDREHVLADVHQGGTEHVAAAIEAAAEAWKDWSRWPCCGSTSST
jgi:1-pyrroline-5-carboxylate dehydrogenase